MADGLTSQGFSADWRRGKEVDGEDGHEGFEGMAEACLHGDEVIRQGNEQEGPCEEDCSGNALPECEREAEKAGKADEEVVGFAGELR